MSFDDYQEKAATFIVNGSPPEERVMGLLEESGEVAGVFKRLLRGDYDPPVAMAKLFKELGDVLWYVSQIARDNNWKLSDVAAENIAKLESRKIRSAIIGSGSDR